MNDELRHHSRPTNPGLPEADPSAAGTRVPTLTLLRGGLPGRMFRVDRDGIVVGRLPECAIQLDEGGVSREHARLTLRLGDAVDLHDLGSTNGTFVNGRRIERHRLRDGDKVQLGSTVVFRFNYQDALDEAFQRQQFDSITRDTLTGCHNRLYFDESLRRDLAWALRHRGSVAVALIDLDHFKAINDAYGHAIGDVVLQQVARALYGALRTYDVLARYGGEEFAVELRDVSAQDARIVAERLRASVAALHIPHEGAIIEPTASLGLALADEAGSDAQMLMRLADQRLYAAKSAGRDRVVWDLSGRDGDGARTQPVDGRANREAIARHRHLATSFEQVPDDVATATTAAPTTGAASPWPVTKRAETLIEGELEPLSFEAFELADGADRRPR